MRKKDIMELKKRLKKDACTFTKMCGCYVNAEKNILLKFRETFLNLQDEEFFKYLEIAKKVLSGTVGNNLLELNFPIDGENLSDRQLSLMGLKKSGLKDDSLLDNFYQSIIDSYDYTGNFLILVFHDAYDVMTRTTDNSKLDESEEVYEYILCAICPVSLSDAALGYFETENRIGARIRDWVVGSPDLGFIFPAFIDRSADIDSIIYYTKNAKEPHPELMEEALGCSSKQTAAEQKETFQTIISKAVGNDEEKSEHLFMEIQEALNTIVEDHDAVDDKDAEPIILTNNHIQDILTDSGLPEEVLSKIENSYTKEFGDAPPAVEHLIDKKALAANEQRKKEERLVKKVQALEERLEQTRQAVKVEAEEEPAPESDTNVITETDSASDLEPNTDFELETDAADVSAPDYDIVLHVKPQKVAQIKSQIIDGKRCLIIPVEENEQAKVNGVEAAL